MRPYIAIIHKDPESGYGVSFPDLSGVVTIDEAMAQAGEVLQFAAEDWKQLIDTEFPQPRTADELRKDAEFRANSAGAILAAMPLNDIAL